MDRRDHEILGHLRREARTGYSQLGRKIRMPLSTVWDRIERLEHSEITRYAALLDFERLGLSCRVIVLLQVPPGQRDKLGAYLAQCKAANNLYALSGDFDYQAELLFPCMRDLMLFMHDLTQRFKLVRKELVHVAEDLLREAYLLKIEH